MRSYIILLPLTLLIFISSCNDMCYNQVLQEIPSPDNKLKAVVFQRDCGATTGFSTQVTILKTEEKLPNTGGDVFSADTDHGKVASDPGRSFKIEVYWNGSHQLQIRFPEKARIFLSAKEIKVSSGIKSEAVEIQYSPI
jgi:hypothetical protein